MAGQRVEEHHTVVRGAVIAGLLGLLWVVGLMNSVFPTLPVVDVVIDYSCRRRVSPPYIAAAAAANAGGTVDRSAAVDSAGTC